MRNPTTSILLALVLAAVAAAPRGLAQLAAEPAAEFRPWAELTYDKLATHLLFDHDQDLWVGTSGGGVYRWETGPAASADTYVKYTRVNDGLADNFVNDMTIDAAGRIWVATVRGLSRYDGSGWQTLDSSNSPLEEDYVSAVAAEGNVLWIGTYSTGLYRYDGWTWTHYDEANSELGDDFVTSIEVDPSGNKWIGVWSAGVDRFDGSTWTSFTPANSGLLSYFVHVKAVDPYRGHVWFWCNDDDFEPDVGTVRFDGVTWTTFLTSNSGISSNYIHSIAVDKSGDTWFQGGGAVSRLGRFGWTTYPVQSIFDYNLPKGKSIAVSGTGALWVGTSSGIAQFDGTGFLPRATPELWDNRVEDVEPTASGRGMWLATRAGLQSYEGGSWTRFTAATSGLPNDDVRALDTDGYDRLWVGTDGGVGRYDGSTWTVFDTSNSGLHSDKVRALAVTKYGVAWFGAGLFGGGVSRFDGTSWTQFTTANSGLVSNHVFSIAVADDGAAWLGTALGLSHFDGSTWTTYTTAQGLTHNFVQDLAIDPDGAVWCATPGGVSKVSGGVVTGYTTANGLAENTVNAVAAAPRGDVWIGYHNSGTSRLRDGTFTTWDFDDGLTSNRVVAIDLDRAGNVWFGTDYNLGIFRGARQAP